MREYKFRAKPKQTGGIKSELAWAYGDLVQKDGKSYIAPSHNAVKVENNLARLMVLIEVDPETVGQYTEAEGKYEGDIIEFEDMGEEGYEYKEGYDFTNRAVIVFENGRFTLDEFMDTNSGLVEELDDHEGTYLVIQHGKVIGNRWDSPELLGG